MKESLYTQVVIWVNNAVLNHIDARVVLPKYEGYEWYVDLNGIINQNILNYYPYTTNIKKIYDILIVDNRMVSKNDSISPTLVYAQTLIVAASCSVEVLSIDGGGLNEASPSAALTTPFHLAIPVHDIHAARSFFGG